MRTEKHNVSPKSSAIDTRFAALARMGEVVFHARDAAVIWGITNTNTLHTILSRYARAGLLFRLHNGLYSIKPLRELDPLLIGSKAIHGFCYASTETILARAGIIGQQVSRITFAGRVSRQFQLAGHNFRLRRLADKYLFNDAGILREGHVRIASPARAIADMLYFNPRYHFDASAHIDWSAVNRIQRDVGYKITRRKHL
jgi:predicted transcriptional regulator of viral defense system